MIVAVLAEAAGQSEILATPAESAVRDRGCNLPHIQLAKHIVQGILAAFLV